MVGPKAYELGHDLVFRALDLLGFVPATADRPFQAPWNVYVSRFSRTITLAFASAAEEAAHSPEIPAPSTTTSADFLSLRSHWQGEERAGLGRQREGQKIQDFGEDNCHQPRPVSCTCPDFI